MDSIVRFFSSHVNQSRSLFRPDHSPAKKIAGNKKADNVGFFVYSVRIDYST